MSDGPDGDDRPGSRDERGRRTDRPPGGGRERGPPPDDGDGSGGGTWDPMGQSEESDGSDDPVGQGPNGRTDPPSRSNPPTDRRATEGVTDRRPGSGGSPNPSTPIAVDRSPSDSATEFGTDTGTGAIALVAVLVALYVVAFDWAATRIYLLNFSIQGPNATAVLLVLFVTAWSLVLIALLSPGPWTLYVGGSLFAGLGLFVGFLGFPVLAAVGGVLAMTFLTPALVALVARTRERFAIGAAAGVLLHHGLRIWLITASPFATTVGETVLTLLVVSTIALGAVLAYRDAVGVPDWSRLGVSAAPALAFLAVEAVWLGMPHVVARWTLRPYVPTALASVVGLVVGVAWVVTRGAPTERDLIGWGVTFTISVGLLLFVGFDPVIVFVVPAQAGAVALLATGSQPRTSSGSIRATVEGCVVQFAAVVCLFLYISAINWAFMPGLVAAVTRGLGLLYLLALNALLPLAAATTALRVDGDDGPAVDHSRRAIAGTTAVGALGLAGFVPAAFSGVGQPSGGGSYRLMSYNVHQYFDGTGTGRYNLSEIAGIIRQADADVVGLQESEGAKITSGNVDGVRWLGEILGYHTAYGAPAQQGTYGVALLSRWPIEDVEVFYLPVADSVARPTVAATVRTPDGPLRVVNTHYEVGRREDAHVEASDRVLRALAGWDRGVLLGDFNLRPGTDAYRVLDDELTDAWRAVNGERDGFTWHAGRPDRRIDYVWLEGQWSVEATTTLGRPSASDHLAVVTEARPSSGGGSSGS